MADSEANVFYGDALDEGVGYVLDATKAFGIVGQAEIARCFEELVCASLELGKTLPAHTFIVSLMDTNRN